MTDRYVVNYDKDYGILIDTTDGRHVCEDTYSPEDASLSRNFAPLVEECNKLARELGTALLCARVEADNFDEARRALRDIANKPCSWPGSVDSCACGPCTARSALEALGGRKKK